MPLSVNHFRLAVLALCCALPALTASAHATPIAWKPIQKGIQLGIGSQSIANGGGEQAIALYVSVAKPADLPRVNWSKLSVAANVSPRPATRPTVNFRAVTIKGWKPTGQAGVYTAVIRAMRYQPAGHWQVWASLPMRVRGKVATYMSPVLTLLP